MILHWPFWISPRLLCGLRVEEAWVQLEYSKNKDPEGRIVYKWTIDLPDKSSYSGEDLKSGCQGGKLQQGFQSLLDFLSACGSAFIREESKESNTGGEDIHLFPNAVAQWAGENLDLLDFLSAEIAEYALIEE